MLENFQPAKNINEGQKQPIESMKAAKTIHRGIIETCNKDITNEIACATAITGIEFIATFKKAEEYFEKSSNERNKQITKIINKHEQDVKNAISSGDTNRMKDALTTNTTLINQVKGHITSISNHLSQMQK